MDTLAFYGLLAERLVRNTDRETPRELSRDICDGIRYALSTLEAMERECLQRHIGEGVTYEALAQQWNMHPDRVRQLEEKAIRKLRETSRWNYIQYGITGYLQAAKAASRIQGFQEGYLVGCRDGREGMGTALDADILTLPVACLGLSTRAAGCLESCGCQRIGDAVRLSEETIRSIRNLRKKSAGEVARALQAYGIGPTAWDAFLR